MPRGQGPGCQLRPNSHLHQEKLQYTLCISGYEYKMWVKGIMEMPISKSPAWVSQLSKSEANLRYFKANYRPVASNNSSVIRGLVLMTTVTSNGDTILELSESPHPTLQAQGIHDDCELDGNEINLVLSKHHPDTKDTKTKYLFSWYNFIKYSRVYSRYQICLSKIRLGIIPILFKCQNSCKQQFQIKYHSNETKTSFALWAVTPKYRVMSSGG